MDTQKKIVNFVKNLPVRFFAVSLGAVMLAAVMWFIGSNTYTVYIEDEEQEMMCVTMKRTAAEILVEQDIAVSSYDEVTFSGLENNVGTININRAFPVSIHADDNVQTVYVTETTVQDSLDKAGVVLHDEDACSPSPDTMLYDSTDVYIDRAFTVNIAVDGGVNTVYLTEGTVSDAIAKAGVTLVNDDVCDLPFDTELEGNTNITITRIQYVTEEELYAIPYETTYTQTSVLKDGRSKVLVSGANGTGKKTVENKLVNGIVEESTVLSDVTVKKAVTQQVLTGTSGVAVSPLGAFSEAYALDENGVPKNYKWVLSSAVCTAYSARTGAKTASGRYAVLGHVAVDPMEIPYGSLLYITSADNSFVYGYAIAADTGTALYNGGPVDVDLLFGSYSESCWFGKRSLNVYVLQ